MYFHNNILFVFIICVLFITNAIGYQVKDAPLLKTKRKTNIIFRKN